MFVDVAVGLPIDGLFTYSIDDHIASKGMRAVVNFNNRKTIAYIINVHNKAPDFEVKPIIKLLDTQPIFDERLLKLAQFVSNHYVCHFGEAVATALPSGKSYNVRTKPLHYVDSSKEVILTEEQEQIYKAIIDQQKKAHCIYGITGSGKTEVYIALAKKMIQEGKSVLYLVPEISISSQMFERLKAVFGQTLVMYHSGMNPNERLISWKRFYYGEAMIVVGTRSAIFMQAPSLGLIIIDEEHDSSYKENSTPRYHARTVAWYRHRQEGAMLVLGSATPSLETLYAIQRNIIVKHQLLKRYGNALLPELVIAPVKASNARTIFSNTLLYSIKKTIEAKQQVILLLNRRGFAPVMLCQDCATAIQCPHCSISLTHHKHKLLCHYCNYETAVSQRCSNCGSINLVMVGSGTQRVEEVLQKMFTGTTIARLDQDSARRKNFLSSVVNDMMHGKIDILLGTQMVAKGFDFPNVSLVGVILADIGLLLPDFRAVERTFALLVQVAGRSGRGEVAGTVIVQTFNPDNPLYHFLKNHDYLGFCNKELSIRKALSYPPYVRLARIVVRGTKEDIVVSVASQCKDILQELSPQFPIITILGPSKAPLYKLASQFRYHIVLKSNNVETLSGIIAQCKKKVNLQGTYLEIDIDPLDLL